MIGFRFPAFGWGASFWAFLVTRISQHWAFLTEGRQGFFNSSLFVQWGKKFFITFRSNYNGIYSSVLVLGEPWISWYFSIFILWILFFFWWGFCFLLFFVNFVSGVCLSVYYACLMLCLLLVCWVRENFSGGLGHLFFVRDSAVWSAGPVQFIWVLAWSGWRDCTGFSLFWLL